jgi:hypothetical protein
MLTKAKRREKSLFLSLFFPLGERCKTKKPAALQPPVLFVDFAHLIPLKIPHLLNNP